ncbi:hypothetical protein D3C85_1811830 [compost metagenome]
MVQGNAGYGPQGMGQGVHRSQAFLERHRALCRRHHHVPARFPVIAVARRPLDIGHAPTQAI